MQPKKYRKLPVVIEAMQFTDESYPDVLQWLEDNNQDAFLEVNDNEEVVSIAIKTLEGTMTGKFDDYVIKGIKGEFYPCDKEIFESTYERVGK